jgi:hypothetical protein
MLDVVAILLVFRPHVVCSNPVSHNAYLRLCTENKYIYQQRERKGKRRKTCIILTRFIEVTNFLICLKMSERHIFWYGGSSSTHIAP